MVRIMDKQEIFSLRFPLEMDQARGRLRVEDNYTRHVEQLIRQVLLTAPGERVHRPDFGCGLRRMVFAPNDPTTASLTQVTIYDALRRWLSSVIDVGSVDVTAVDSTLSIAITYVLKARLERRVLNLEVTL
ncbi:MAG: GPW/gp25 family protein [bacterium]|jgi:phage baseplate assembly protein W